VCKTISNLQRAKKPIVLLCPADVSEVFTEQWKESASEQLEYDYSSNQYYLKINEKTGSNRNG
jgi:hypothetical protein